MTPLFERSKHALFGFLGTALLVSACVEAGPERPAPEPAAATAPRLFSPYRALDPSAPPVTAENVLESERFWPYRVALAEPWPIPGKRPLPAGRAGVLIRVEESGNPRIDFGSYGKFEIPVAQTDLVERANQIRLGEADKWGPNFVYAIQPRMLDSSAEPLQPFDPNVVGGFDGFLCVFADPRGEGFEDLVREIAPLSERYGESVMTILFPLGRHPEEEVGALLKQLKWRVPFVRGYLAQGYTNSLLVDPSEVPSVMLQSPEGRLLFFQRFSREIVPELAAVLAAKFTPPPSVASGEN